MMTMEDIRREFDMDFDHDELPEADAPGGHVGTIMVNRPELDGISASSLITAAVCARMTTLEVWQALDAAHEAALLALEEGDLVKAAREVGRADLLTEETERRADRCQRSA